jgi:hypothetical protein
MAVKGAFISDLDPLASIGQLPGGLFEVEVLAGPVAGAYVTRYLTLEQLVDYLKSQISVSALTADQLLPLLKAGTGIALSLVTDSSGVQQVLISNTVGSAQPVVAPAPPTNGHADDKADIFYGTINPLYKALGDYELYYPGSGGNVPATNGQADLVGTTLTIRNLTGNYPAGSVGMRVAASGNRPASPWLTNADPFTGTATPAKGYQKLYTDKYPAAA